MILDKLDRAGIYCELTENFATAFAYLDSKAYEGLPAGKYDVSGEDVFALINEYETKADELHVFEAHKKYIDLHYILDGEEVIKYAPLGSQPVSREYDKESDYALYQQGAEYIDLKLKAGMFAIFFPWDLHMPGIGDSGSRVRKVVLKIRLT